MQNELMKKKKTSPQREAENKLRADVHTEVKPVRN